MGLCPLVLNKIKAEQHSSRVHCGTAL